MANSKNFGSETQLKIRAMKRSDLRQLLEIFSAAIPHSELSRSIYLAPGAEVFLAHLLDHPALQTSEQLWGVDLEGQGLVGAAHTRLIGQFQHLNNYAVLPQFQGRGIGARMMEHWHEIARSQGAMKLSLDVALENERARKHYASFGFVDAARTNEYRWKGTTPQLDTSKAHLADWPLARASFDAFGFGRFSIVIDGESWNVDLRPKDFRLTSADPRLLAILRSMSATHDILFRTSELLEGDSVWSFTGAVVRMMKHISK